MVVFFFCRNSSTQHRWRFRKPISSVEKLSDHRILDSHIGIRRRSTGTTSQIQNHRFPNTFGFVAAVSVHFRFAIHRSVIILLLHLWSGCCGKNWRIQNCRRTSFAKSCCVWLHPRYRITNQTKYNASNLIVFYMHSQNQVEQRNRFSRIQNLQSTARCGHRCRRIRTLLYQVVLKVNLKLLMDDSMNNKICVPNVTLHL